MLPPNPAAPYQNDNRMTRRWGDKEEEEEAGNEKGAQDVVDITWACRLVFFFLSHLIFILLTKLLSTTLSYWQQQQQWNGPCPSPVSHLLAGWIAGMMKWQGGEKWRNREEEDETTREGRWNDRGRKMKWQGKGNKMTGNDDDNEGTTPPTSSLISNCLWSGSQVEWQWWQWVVTRRRGKGWWQGTNNNGRGVWQTTMRDNVPKWWLQLFGPR